jgi:pimeloyl-ACP methyl ester carboxylesterase
VLRETLAQDEEHFRIPGPIPDLQIFLRYLASARPFTDKRRSVLYVHGATFPSALSVAHRFDGRSWRDELCDAGFDVWALDFYGFGYSDRYPEMAEPANEHQPLCLAADAAEQINCAVRFILEHQGLSSLSLLAHSWGSMVCGRFAAAHPALVDRLAFLAPIARREPTRYFPRPTGPAWRIVSVEDQWARFVEDVPPEEPPVLSRVHFDDWAQRYLDTDEQSRMHDPVGVKVPSGPFVEILRAWQGELAYDPSQVQAPVVILRGEWDGLVTDTDARWLFDAFTHAPIKRDIKISRGTHLMHLEMMRTALWQESVTFLRGDDVAAITL